MEVRSVLNTHNRLRAVSACEELRAHAIKCDTVEPGGVDIQAGITKGRPLSPDPGIQVVVAREDESRAAQILAVWLRRL